MKIAGCINLKIFNIVTLVMGILFFLLSFYFGYKEQNYTSYLILGIGIIMLSIIHLLNLKTISEDNIKHLLGTSWILILLFLNRVAIFFHQWNLSTLFIYLAYFVIGIMLLIFIKSFYLSMKNMKRENGNVKIYDITPIIVLVAIIIGIIMKDWKLVVLVLLFFLFLILIITSINAYKKDKPITNYLRGLSILAFLILSYLFLKMQKIPLYTISLIFLFISTVYILYS